MNKSNVGASFYSIELPESTYVCDFCKKMIITKSLGHMIVYNKDYTVTKSFCPDCFKEAQDWSKDE